MIKGSFYINLILLLSFSIIVSCSDVFLESDRKPAGLEPERMVTVFGDDFKLGVNLVDQDDVPFRKIPGWIDTIYSSDTENILKIVDNGSNVEIIKTGRTDLRVEMGNVNEKIEVRVAPHFYLTQSVQRLDRILRLVAGKPVMVRLFLEGDEIAAAQGNITVELYQNGSLTETINYPSQQVSLNKISETVAVLDLPVPASFIQPGLSILVSSGQNFIYPEDGAPYPLDIVSLSEFHIRLIPIYVSQTDRTGQVNAGNIDEFVEQLLDMFPIDPENGFVADLHSPVTVTANPANRNDFYLSALQKIRAVWINEGKPDYYYYGVIPQAAQGIVGLGYVSELPQLFLRQAVGWDRLPSASETLAHEVGHNMGRLHAPCGGPDEPDPNYPYPNASIGTYGFEVDESELKPPHIYKSFMSYCDPAWISDYTYSALVDFRVAANSGPQTAQTAEDVLFVWGKMSSEGLTLYPAFRVSAPPTLPSKTGPYTLSGYDNKGNKLFSVSFAGHRFSRNLNSTRSFSFAIPVNRVHIEELATLKLTGKGLIAMQRADSSIPQSNFKVSIDKNANQAVILSWNSSKYKMMMVKNVRTGEVLGFTGEGVSQIKTDAHELKLYFSDGVRTTVKKVFVN